MLKEIVTELWPGKKSDFEHPTKIKIKNKEGKKKKKKKKKKKQRKKKKKKKGLKGVPPRDGQKN